MSVCSTRMVLPEVQGHRASGDLAPHNSLKAVRRASEIGVRSVEFDVRKTIDSFLVVTHGPEIHGGVESSTLTELQAVDLGDGERVPLLADFVDACLKHELSMNIDIKPGYGPAAVLEILELLRAKKALHFCRISSFDHALLKVVMETAPEVPVGPIYNDHVQPNDPHDLSKGFSYEDTPDDFASWFAHHDVQGDSVNMRAECLLKEPSLIDKARGAGKQVMAWFPCSPTPGYEDGESTYKRLMDLGVDVICCNRPDILQQVICAARDVADLFVENGLPNRAEGSKAAQLL